MTTTRFADHLLTGIHSARPAASAVPAGTLYSCTTHSLVYQSDGSSWTTWASLIGSVAADPIVDAKGDLIVGTAADTAARLAVGSNNQVLVADSAQTTGVKWAAVPGGGMVADTLWDAKGDLAIGSGADTGARLAVGSNGQVLTADSAQTLGVKWAAAGGGGVTVDSYVEFTSPVTPSHNTAAAADTVVTAAAVTADGSTVYCIEIYASSWNQASGGAIHSLLYDGSTQVGEMAWLAPGVSGTFRQPLFARCYITPTAASHTYSWRVYYDTSAGSIRAGNGTGGNEMPGYIRVTHGG